MPLPPDDEAAAAERTPTPGASGEAVAGWIGQARAAWAELDRRIAALQAATTLACPATCGRCCEVSAVETTVVEMLPMAEHLLAAGLANTVLDRLDSDDIPPLVAHPQRTEETAAVEAEAAKHGVPARCALYEPGLLPGQGRCGHYAHRPTICRLYGFAARLEKGGLQLVGCATHNEATPRCLEDAQAAIDAGTADPPLYATELARVTLRSPSLGRDRYPINEALRRAIHVLRDVAGS